MVSVLMEFFDLLGVAFLKAAPEGSYDAVIVDSSDPIGMLLPSGVFLCCYDSYFNKIGYIYRFWIM